jgi:hypothetical protein
MPRADEDDMSREEMKEQAAAKRELKAAVITFNASKKTDHDKEELNEVATKYVRILEGTPLLSKALGLSDTFNYKKKGAPHLSPHGPSSHPPLKLLIQPQFVACRSNDA